MSHSDANDTVVDTVRPGSAFTAADRLGCFRQRRAKCSITDDGTRRRPQ